MIPIKILVYLGYMSLGIAGISRAISFVPNAELEPLPGPPILNQYSGSASWIILWTALWGISGSILILGPKLGGKVTLFHTDRTSFRLDDLGFVIYSALCVTWGVSYYFEWIRLALQDIWGTLYLSGGVLVSTGIFIFDCWAIGFMTREQRGGLIAE